MEGQLEPAGERWRLRFVRRLPHPPEKVWRALTEPEHLAAWFPTEIRGERAAGARLRFVFPRGEGPTLDGEMIACDPPRHLELRWGEGEELRFDLEPEGEGTVLTVVNTFDELGKAARDAAGWHACLDMLAHHLAAEQPPGGPGESWPRLHAGYIERFPAEASTIGPPNLP
jgi:uncharacterized protein YndB with AHSA1/START domain